MTAPSRLAAALFPMPPRRFAWARPAQVALRSVHIAAMGLVLGGIGCGADAERLLWPIVVVVATGFALLGVDLAKSCWYAVQGAGAAVWLKLALLGLGNLFPAARLELYVAATVVASVGAHMTSALRHYSLVHGRVLD